MSNKLQNALANKNSLGKKRKAEIINDRTRKEFRREEETGIGRKAIYLLLTYMAEMHPEIAERSEYKQALHWYETVEGIKASVDEEVNG